MTFANAHALIVGVGQYQYIPEHNVPIAASDALAVSQVLQDPTRCAYPAGQVSLLTNENATRAALLSALDELGARLAPADTLFMFYVGHGVYGTDGDYQLTTHDVQLQGAKAVPASGLSEKELIEKLRKIKAKRVLLAINACHSGELSPSFDLAAPALVSEAPPGKLSEALLSTGEGRITISACRPEQQSWIGKGSLSLFTSALVSGLKGEAPNSRGYISAFGLYEYIYFSAKEAAEALGQTQEPELTVLKGVGPFPVALYRGASQPGDFDLSQPLPADTAAREVSPERSQRSFKSYNVNIHIGGDSSGNIIIGDNNTVSN